MYTTQARHCDNVICTKYTRDATTANTVQCLYLRARARARVCGVCVCVICKSGTIEALVMGFRHNQDVHTSPGGVV